MTSVECNLIKNIPRAPLGQGELLDLTRSHLEEKYCIKVCLMMANSSWQRCQLEGCVMETHECQLREDNLGLMHAWMEG